MCCLSRLLLVLPLAGFALHATAATRVVEPADLDRAPERLEAPPLALSPEILSAGTQDTVTMIAIVGPGGQVVRVEAVQAANAETARVASAAVRRWVFNPCFSKGEPVSFRLPVAVAIRPGQAGDGVADTGAIVGTGIELQVATLIYETIPEYPAALRDNPVEGFAMVNLHVDAAGRPGDPVVEFASRPEFSGPAAAAVLEWAFEPTTSRGAAVAARTSVPVVFPARSAPWDADARRHESQLQYHRSYDEAPQNKASTIVIYPYEALIAGTQGIATVGVLVSPDGHVVKVDGAPGSDPDFVAASRASLATWQFFPAMKAGRPVYGLIAMQMTFEPTREGFEFDDTSHELIKGLREGTAAVYSLKQVDQMPRPIKQVAPTLPPDHGDAVEGEALIECIVDTRGRPQLPRVVRATNPGLGWAAATAVAQWRFEPALKDGAPVACRARLPIRFKAPAPAAIP